MEEMSDRYPESKKIKELCYKTADGGKGGSRQ
jgi:hypothetical protein